MAETQQTYAERRKAFMERMQPDSVAILRSAPEFERGIGGDVPYQQDNDFYYLTGYEEPEAICVLAPNHKEHQHVLFVRPRNKEMETWTGRRKGIEGAVSEYGAQFAYTLEERDEKLPQYLEGMTTLYYGNGVSEFADSWLLDLIRSYRRKLRPFINTVIDPGTILNELRLYKQSDELAAIRKAAQITEEAHTAAMKAAHPGMYEYELEAVIEYTYLKNGAMYPAYASIVGSGPNATILHYSENTRRMEDGDLVLIDAGASYQHYAADITRTFPVNGHFTPAQRDIYELVLKAEMAAIESVQPGKTLDDIHNLTVEILTTGMLELGILQGDVKTLIEEKKYRQFYMHSTGHWMGLDVHDRGPYKVKDVSRPFAPGMVFTIEPGLYIDEGAEGVDPKYWNIGVRIEDDVLVTEQGCEVLTGGVVKTVADIEALMQSSK